MHNFQCIKDINVILTRSDKNGRYFMIEFYGNFGLDIHDVHTRLIFDTVTSDFYDWLFDAWWDVENDKRLDSFVDNSNLKIAVRKDSQERFLEAIKKEWDKMKDKSFMNKLIIDSMI